MLESWSLVATLAWLGFSLLQFANHPKSKQTVAIAPGSFVFLKLQLVKFGMVKLDILTWWPLNFVHSVINLCQQYQEPPHRMRHNWSFINFFLVQGISHQTFQVTVQKLSRPGRATRWSLFVDQLTFFRSTCQCSGWQWQEQEQDLWVQVSTKQRSDRGSALLHSSPRIQPLQWAEDKDKHCQRHNGLKALPTLTHSTPLL